MLMPLPLPLLLPLLVLALALALMATTTTTTTTTTTASLIHHRLSFQYASPPSPKSLSEWTKSDAPACFSLGTVSPRVNLVTPPIETTRRGRHSSRRRVCESDGEIEAGSIKSSNYEASSILSLVRKRRSAVFAAYASEIDFDDDDDDDDDDENDYDQGDDPPVSPREWLERLEASDGSGGAYTVIRCDLPERRDLDGVVDGIRTDARRRRSDGVEKAEFVNGAGDEQEETLFTGRWRLWGIDFHLDRLKSSYTPLIKKGGLKGDLACAPVKADVLDAASERSRIGVDALLADAEHALDFDSDEGGRCGDEEYGEGTIQTLMLTLLWTPPRPGSSPRDEEGAIIVRGHAFCDRIIVAPSRYDPTPITAAVAAPVTDKSDTKTSVVDAWSALPNRCDSSPEAKLSSWCRIRRSIEDGYKADGQVGEVLLVRPMQSEDNYSVGEFEVLEGLTSNLFVVYADGTIRTAGSGILGGYARGLVLQCAPRLGLRVDLNTPIRLNDAEEGEWAEAFVTSSVRLVVPVGRILIPRANEVYIDDRQQGEWRVGVSTPNVWTERPLDELSWSTRHWRLLYNEIIQFGFLLKAG